MGLEIMKNRLNGLRRFGGIFSDTKVYTIIEMGYEGQPFSLICSYLKKGKRFNIMVIEYSCMRKVCLSERTGQREYNLIPKMDLCDTFSFASI